MSVFEKYIYVDYENVQDVKLDVTQKTVKVMIFVGKDQTKIPIDLVQKTQPLGISVEWIRVNEKGRNVLDSFITFYLGKDINSNSGKEFIIVSKDTGYDPLISELKKSGINARRIGSFQELSQKKVMKADEECLNKIIKNLFDRQVKHRPKTRSSLTAFISNQLKGKPKQEITNTMSELFNSKFVSEENGKITYSFNKG